MRLVCRQAEHDQVGVESVNDMLRVRVVRRMRALTTDVIHDLVLAFTRHGSVGDDDLELPAGRQSSDTRSSFRRTHSRPARIFIQLLRDPIPQTLGQ